MVEANDGYVAEHPNSVKCIKGICNPNYMEGIQL